MDTETLNLMTVPEVAERLNCSVQLIYLRIEQGALPAIRIGPRGLRVDPRDLAAFLEGWNERA
ncbi:MAG: helix-turn-helix domain-containing protein [Actinomycetota bacterium]|nr:helix-turn-helix domain-containing protein [Actinomycetota bacterium]